MGRPRKKGLDFFPLDANMFYDLKIKRLLRDCEGGKGYSVFVYFLSRIYKEGYYINWDDDWKYMASCDLKFEEEFIEKCIDCMLRVDLLNKELFDKYKILTSHGIQKQYFLIFKLNKRILPSSLPYLLIEFPQEDIELTTEETAFPQEDIKKCETEKDNSFPQEETEFPQEETDLNPEETEFPQEGSAQNKIKKSKVKESKEKHSSSADIRAREGKDSSDGPMTGENEKIQLIKSDKEWLFSMQNKFGLGTEEIYSWLADFATDCACRGKQHHHDIADLKQHFVFWLTKQPIKTKQEPKQPPTKQQWIKCKKELCESSPKEAEMCFRELEFGSFEPYNNNTLTLSVPSPGIDEKIEKNHFEIFTKTIKKYFGENIRLQYYTR